MQKSTRADEKLYSVEFIRFIFSVIIVYFHIFHTNIQGYEAGAVIFDKLSDGCNYAGIIVECFLIISGYFLYSSIKRKPDISVKEFAYNKFARLWCVLAFEIIVGVVFFKFNGYESFYNILFLQSVGVTPKVRGITWYISPLFFVLVFIFALYKNFKNKGHFNLILGVMVYFSYTVLVNKCGEVFSRDNVFGFLSLAVLRVVAGVGLGYLIAVGENSVRQLDYIKNFEYTLPEKIAAFVIVSAVELLTFYKLMVHFLYREKSYNQAFYVVILFSIFFICLISRKGIFTLAFNNKLFGFAGKYAYSIYVMQQISFCMLRKTLWLKADFVHSHPLRLLAISLAFSVIVGVATYYIVEKPSYMLLSKFGKKLFAK